MAITQGDAHLYRTVAERWRDGLRLCSICGEAKPAASYKSVKLSADGLASECRDCSKRVNTMRRREARALLKQPVCTCCGGTGRASGA